MLAAARRADPFASERKRWSPRALLARFLFTLAAALALVLSGCGPLGDDDEEEPTATAAALPAETEHVATPPVDSSALRDATPAASPIEGAPSTAATPEDGSPAAAERSGSVAAPASVPAGTPRARPGRSTARTTAPRATGAATGSRSVGTEVSKEAGVCAPPSPLPSPTSRAPHATTAFDVNLRTGPGTNCDIIEQLPIATALTLRSGPVERDGLEWVLVETADGDEGWLAAQYVAEA